MSDEWMLVYLPNAEIYGPFPSQAAAYRWARKVPNELFETMEEWDRAETNADFWAARVRGPK